MHSEWLARVSRPESALAGRLTSSAKPKSRIFAYPSSVTPRLRRAQPGVPRAIIPSLNLGRSASRPFRNRIRQDGPGFPTRSWTWVRNEDLVALRSNLNREGAKYVVIGGMAIIEDRSQQNRQGSGLLKTDDFDLETFFDIMLALEKSVDSVEDRCVKITLSTFAANLSFHVLNEIQFSMKPMMFAHLLFAGYSSTELAGHRPSITEHIP